MTLSAGTMLGPYEILELVGEGGMGAVWKARDTRLGRLVAIKRLTSAHADRFALEARAIAALNHPHICQIHDVGSDYLVLEYLEGQPLRGPLPPAEAVRLAKQIAAALEEAHSKGVLHRDLKPANIMVTRCGPSDPPDSSIAKLLDFGLAKMVKPEAETTQTVEGTVAGTAAYMSPEQAEGKPLDVRSDIFSFGAVLFELLSGQRAFGGASTAAVLSAVLRDEPAPIQAPPALYEIVRRCLQKRPALRFQLMSEVRAALEHAATGMPLVPGTREPSIAVLPFTNLSADKEYDYFSDGLAEEIINVLARVTGLKVAGRTSSFYFRGKDVEFTEIGRKLNVDHILEGSVRTSGKRIRVTVQLIKVADGFQLWSQHYDREMTDVFAVQDEITHAIAAALQVKLSPETAPSRRRTPNLRAYEAYLKAREHWFRPTPESLALVKEFLDHAIEIDPAFALPYSLLGGYYTMLAAIGVKPARQVMPLARAAEQAALQVEPSLPEAHALLAVCAGTYDYNWNEADRHWRLAMAREPVSRDIRFWYGNHYLLPLGRPREAVEAMAWVLQEDPLNLLYRHHLGVGLRHSGRLDEAEAELRKVLEIDEDFPLAVGTLGAVCAQQARFDEALALTERAHALTPWNKPIAGQLAALLVRAGATSRAGELTDRLRSGNAYGAPTGLALYHAMSGEFDQAAAWTERAIEERYPPLVAILAPLLRSTAGWPALSKMMNVSSAPIS